MDEATMPDLPFDVVESVSRQLQVLPKLSPDLLLVSRSWKSALLPTIRAQKNWARLQWVFYELERQGVIPVDYCMHRPCGHSCMFRGITDTRLAPCTEEGVCYIEYMCSTGLPGEPQGNDSLCVDVTRGCLAARRAKSAAIAAAVTANGMEVTWPSGTEFEGPSFITLDAADKAFLMSWKRTAASQRKSPPRKRSPVNARPEPQAVVNRSAGLPKSTPLHRVCPHCAKHI